MQCLLVKGTNDKLKGVCFLEKYVAHSAIRIYPCEHRKMFVMKEKRLKQTSDSHESSMVRVLADQTTSIRSIPVPPSKDITYFEFEIPDGDDLPPGDYIVTFSHAKIVCYQYLSVINPIAQGGKIINSTTSTFVYLFIYYILSSFQVPAGA